MKSLERAYSHVRSGVSLICEEFEDVGLPAVSDLEIKNAQAVPSVFSGNFVPGSGKAQWSSGDVDSTWRIEYLLKLPLKDWSDGTEERDVTFDYIERQVGNELPQSGGVPGEEFCRSHAVVLDDQSNEEFVTVRCMLRGGRDV
jgi:hypothetical protein